MLRITNADASVQVSLRLSTTYMKIVDWGEEGGGKHSNIGPIVPGQYGSTTSVVIHLIPASFISWRPMLSMEPGVCHRRQHRAEFYTGTEDMNHCYDPRSLHSPCPFSCLNDAWTCVIALERFFRKCFRLLFPCASSSTGRTWRYLFENKPT